MPAMHIWQWRNNTIDLVHPWVRNWIRRHKPREPFADKQAGYGCECEDGQTQEHNTPKSEHIASLDFGRSPGGIADVEVPRLVKATTPAMAEPASDFLAPVMYLHLKLVRGTGAFLIQLSEFVY